MNDPGESPNLIVVQLVAVSIAATILVVFSAGAVIGVAVGRGAGAPFLLVIPVMAVLVFRVVAGATAAVTPLGRTPGGRWWWAVLVCGLGSVALAACWAILAAVTRPTGGHLVLAGLPYALVAALLLRGRRPRLAAGLVSLLLVGAAAVGLRFSGPDEVAARLAAAGKDRASLYVMEIPGYVPNGDEYGERLGSRAFMPANSADIPAYRYADVAAYPRKPCAEPQPGQFGGRLEYTSCTTEADGYVYRHAEQIHGYEVRRGAVTVEVSGPLAVDRQVLREGARTARPATAADLKRLGRTGEKGLFMADIPGFRPDPILSEGVHFESLAGGGGPAAVLIMLGTGQPVDQFCRGRSCATEPGGLVYRSPVLSRAPEDQSGYLITRGATTVQVTGGANVDRALLRDAVLAARPPTNDEILTGLPAPQGRGPIARWRGWLKETF
ncbi:hypothetical protein OHA21_21280 [Actinoplanes sp. NBC_00393]|uniref:hypothetical protein n=1 Tax=Actinoplanes sp. NBC_00393 TaxID=2975953 RepID=UPI002E1D7814